MTQDIGTAKLRFDDYPINKMIYVVGNEQNYHFQVLSILLDKLGFEFGKGLVHFSYGMVELPEGKMKSREGTVVDADDLMAEMISTAREISQELGKLNEMTPEEAENIARIVGLGSLKYFILKVDPRKNMTFNRKSLSTSMGIRDHSSNIPTPVSVPYCAKQRNRHHITGAVTAYFRHFRERREPDPNDRRLCRDRERGR